MDSVNERNPFVRLYLAVNRFTRRGALTRVAVAVLVGVGFLLAAFTVHDSLSRVVAREFHPHASGGYACEGGRDGTVEKMRRLKRPDAAAIKSDLSFLRYGDHAVVIGPDGETCRLVIDHVTTVYHRRPGLGVGFAPGDSGGSFGGPGGGK